MARLPITSLPARAACLCAVAAVAMLPASAAAASCAGTNLTPTSGNVEQVRAAVLCLINQERERHGEGTLVANAKLTHAAQAHSRDMANEDYFSHIAPNGETPLQRMRSSGYLPNAQDGYVVGENIAWGTMWLATPQSIVSAWMASPGHRANILDGAYRETGVGVEPRPPASLAEGQPGALYTQDFGVIIPAGHSSRHVAAGSGRITSGTRNKTNGEGSNTNHGSSRRQSRHRHRVRAWHRARHRRAARRKRRAGAHKRSRRRRRKAGR